MSEEPNDHASASPWTPSLSFDAWADLSARLLGLDAETRVGILEREKIEAGAWAECEHHYSVAIVDDLAHGRMQRAEQYGRRCAAELKRRKAGENADPPAPAADAEPVGEAQGAPMRIGAPLEAEPAVVPSYLREDGKAPAQAVPASDGSMTAAVFELPTAFRAGALPFSKSAAPSLPLAPAETRPLPPPASPGGTEVLGGTLPLSPDAGLKAALPFADAAPPVQTPTFPRLPLPTYASLCAELSVFPERKADIRQRYGIASDEAHAALDELWRGRLEASEKVRGEWQALVAKHVDSLRRPAR